MKHQQGVLLVNLGTPSAATPKAIKRYLAEFLGDRHVVDLNPLIWYPILHGLVLPKRSNYIASHYKKIWIEGKSPLLHYSEQLQIKLQTRLSEILPNVVCELAMTYGEPSIKLALEKLTQCETLTVLPLFAQYSTTTTLAVFDKLTKLLTKDGSIKRLNYLRDYADNASYINALFLQIQQSIKLHGAPDQLLISYHGIPVRYIEKRNDDYQNRCELTTKLLIDKLQNEGIHIPITMAYQSKFGKKKWTTPNISDLLKKMATDGAQHVHVLCPGFAVDCIETIYEIDEQNRQLFLNAGGKAFHYIPALNDSKLHIDLLLDLIKLELNNPSNLLR